MAKRTESAEELRERILAAMRADIGISERMALPFVESVMQCFAGERPYFPAAPREYPMAEIEAALVAGIPVKQVMSKFDLSRAKLHDLFPGGLPRATKRQLSTTLTKVETK
ncbi:hypothetical protein K1516_07490 [Stenotrophomonas maltophilia]|uniref:hypothetical protein n=1 Tax=Stenotrophomonas maltophilia TaxID=40324 RepID=UPI00200EA4AE|nr:hypothetical protein [Stenotrophomonas maltophilia]UQA71943.1 hypothetical protein K1516_07490 [Stenotrophomonas maltophilia]